MEDVLNNPEILLDSKEAIKHNMTPFGRKLGVVSDGVYPFYHIAFTDSKPGSFPTELAGKWTSLAYCDAALSAYLHQLWAFSDAKQETTYY